MNWSSRLLWRALTLALSALSPGSLIAKWAISSWLAPHLTRQRVCGCKKAGTLASSTLTLTKLSKAMKTKLSASLGAPQETMSPLAPATNQSGSTRRKTVMSLSTVARARSQATHKMSNLSSGIPIETSFSLQVTMTRSRRGLLKTPSMSGSASSPSAATHRQCGRWTSTRAVPTS